MNHNIFDLTGKVAVVTRANTGIGQGICIALAEAGAEIVGVGRSDMTETLEQVVAAGAKFYPVKADLLTLDCLDKIISGALSAAGRIDILINNAGIIPPAPTLPTTQSPTGTTS